jgi:hypothetical protein
VESYSLNSKGRIRATLLKASWKDQKGKVAEDRVLV